MSFRMSAGWHSLPVRLTTALVLALLLLLPVATVYAGDAGASPVTPTNSDICVEGTVIDHEEEPLDDGRIVTATMGGVLFVRRLRAGRRAAGRVRPVY